MTVKLTVARLLLFLITVATLVVLLAAFLSAGEPPERAERGKGHSVPEDAEVARNSKSYAFYVGKDLTADGGVLLGRTTARSPPVTGWRSSRARNTAPTRRSRSA